MKAIATRLPWLTSALLLLALLVAWGSERVLQLEAPARQGAWSLVALLFFASSGLRLARAKSMQDAGKRLANKLGGMAQTSLLVCAILYYQWSQTGAGSALEGWLLAGWLACLLLPMPVILALDLVLSNKQPTLSERHVRDVGMATLTCALLSLSAIPAFLAISAHDKTFDLANSRAASPGESTKKLFDALGAGVEVHAFLAPNSELVEPLSSYFSQLPDVSYKRHDQLLEPRLAAELGVKHNRVVAISTVSPAGLRRTRRLELGERGAAARATLRDLDLLVSRALRPLARQQRTVYVLRGHDELSQDASRPSHKRISKLVQTLEPQLNLRFEPLGLSDGLATGVPEDAAALLLLGPERAYLPQEIKAIEGYLDRGGALLLAIEPSLTPAVSQPQASLSPLLGKMSVRLGAGVIASKQNILPTTRSKADRLNLITRQFEPHPAITSLATPSTREAVLLPSAGFLEILASPESEALLQPAKLILSPRGSWADLDDDLEYTPPKETRDSRAHAVAISPRQRPGGAKITPWRGIILADSTALSDLALEQSKGNEQLATDLIGWLLEDEELSGKIDRDVDVRIIHSRSGEEWIFYGTTLGAPLLVLLLGFWRTRRRSAGRTEEA